MKICHVNLASGFGGGENQTLHLIKQQLAMGYDLTVVANPRSPLADAVGKLDCALVQIQHSLQGHHRSVTKDSSLIHVHEGRAIYWAWIQSLRFGIPYIATRRMIDKEGRKRWLAKQAYGRARALVGLSDKIVQRLQMAHPMAVTHKIPSSPVRYPVDPGAVAEIRKRFEDKFLVIHAATMLPHKGFDVTIDTARQLEKSHADIRFALLGDGRDRAVLEQRAGSLSNVHFVGKRADMGDWLAAADVLALPSYDEGLGSVILEAFESGLPVVASDTGGIPEVIEDGVSGLLIPPGDSRALAAAILRIQSEPELGKTLVARAKDRLTGFRIEHTALMYERIYKSVQSSLAPRQHAPPAASSTGVEPRSAPR